MQHREPTCIYTVVRSWVKTSDTVKNKRTNNQETNRQSITATMNDIIYYPFSLSLDEQQIHKNKRKIYKTNK